MELFDVGNHLKPAGLFNSGYRVELQLVGGVPQEITFRQSRLDGNPFIPTGVFASIDVVIEIENFKNFRFTATPFGKNYPAPIDQRLRVYGDGFVELLFVDYSIVRASGTGSGYYY